jgi:hypothetical protein
VGQGVLRLAFWGVLLMAMTQPAKVLSSVRMDALRKEGTLDERRTSARKRYKITKQIV